MCFYVEDCEGYCLDETVGPSDGPRHCDDCGQPVPPGTVCRRLVWGDRSTCRNCGCDWDGHAGPCVDEDTEEVLDAHDFGCVSRGTICPRCDRVRDAVRARELSAGCRRDEANPLVGNLWEALEEEGERYGTAVLAACPDLIGDPFVRRLLPDPGESEE